MGPEETRKTVAAMLSQLMQENSLLAPYVADNIAEQAVEKLLEGRYLISGGKVRTIREEGHLGHIDPAVGEAWNVYTVAETDPADEESNGTDGS
jgi:hypothetical protein